MNKRCIVSCATGAFYIKNQERQLDSFVRSVDNVTIYTEYDCPAWETGKHYGIDLIVWRDIFPAGSKPHEESPYGFKTKALQHAYEKGYTSVLWLDSPAYTVQENVSPIFEKMEEAGYYAMSHTDPLNQWVSEAMLERFNLTQDRIKDVNLPSGSCYGFDVSNAFGLRLFELLFQAEEIGLFKSHKVGETGWHRHDETILALLLTAAKLPILSYDPLFQSDSPDCVIRSGASWAQDAKVYGE
jgi:hypothetical protein